MFSVSIPTRCDQNSLISSTTLRECEFQFRHGAIKTPYYPTPAQPLLWFQFRHGAIKTEKLKQQDYVGAGFNSDTVRSKHAMVTLAFPALFGFNSDTVRSKPYFTTSSTHRLSGFNSDTVRSKRYSEGTAEGLQSRFNSDTVRSKHSNLPRK